MTNIQLPAGLFDSNVELFSKNGQAMAIYKGEIKSVFDLPADLLTVLYTDLLNNDAAIIALNEENYTTKQEMLSKYIECRFGELDHVPDIVNGEIKAHEFVSCSLRGSCKMEGLVCLPINYNGQPLTDFELKLIDELATENTIPVMAENLGVCKNTLEFRKKILFNKLNVQSRARLVAVAFEQNLINKGHGR